ncbi:MAG TPA: uracil-DNA glycosylase family protein [Thermoanaerobaculia bacterium]|nr:uracil-DNA glycosylase family protein [Thermoanaerobaculia bacterium]
MARAVDRRLAAHVEALVRCRRCPTVVPPPVAALPLGRPKVMVVGQAPGPREADRERLFAHTAGARLFSWFAELGVPEEEARARIWIAAAIRCFPGRAPQGGDRVPSPQEVANCAPWLEAELRLLRPLTIIALGQLGISRFLPPSPLAERVGQVFTAERDGRAIEVVPLPHPSGRSTWLNHPENQKRLRRALALLKRTRGWRETFGDRR